MQYMHWEKSDDHHSRDGAPHGYTHFFQLSFHTAVHMVEKRGLNDNTINGCWKKVIFKNFQKGMVATHHFYFIFEPLKALHTRDIFFFLEQNKIMRS